MSYASPHFGSAYGVCRSHALPRVNSNRQAFLKAEGRQCEPRKCPKPDGDVQQPRKCGQVELKFSDLFNAGYYFSARKVTNLLHHNVR